VWCFTFDWKLGTCMSCKYCAYLSVRSYCAIHCYAYFNIMFAVIGVMCYAAKKYMTVFLDPKLTTNKYSLCFLLLCLSVASSNQLSPNNSGDQDVKEFIQKVNSITFLITVNDTWDECTEV
jgi:hypothetical protein